MKLEILKTALFHMIASSNDDLTVKETYMKAYEELVELEIVRKAHNIDVNDHVQVIDAYAFYILCNDVLYDCLGIAARSLAHTDNQVKSLTLERVFSKFKETVHNEYWDLKVLTDSQLRSVADTLLDLWQDNELHNQGEHTAAGRFMTYDRGLVDKLYNGYLEKLQETEPNAGFEDVCANLDIENYERKDLGDITGELYEEEITNEQN